MRHAMGVAAVVLIAGAFVIGFAGSAGAGPFINSKHDLSAASTGGTTLTGVNNPCMVCHMPHNGKAESPLGSRNVLAAGSYTPYNSPTLDAAPITINGLDLVCMSCHDGTTGLDNYVGGANSGVNMGAVAANFGTDLSAQHPVSFDYDAVQLADSQFVASSGGMVGGVFQLYDDGTGAFKMMRCASCHAVHNGTPTSGVQFLRADPNTSTFCTTCHNK